MSTQRLIFCETLATLHIFICEGPENLICPAQQTSSNYKQWERDCYEISLIKFPDHTQAQNADGPRYSNISDSSLCVWQHDPPPHTNILYKLHTNMCNTHAAVLNIQTVCLCLWCLWPKTKETGNIFQWHLTSLYHLKIKWAHFSYWRYKNKVLFSIKDQWLCICITSFIQHCSFFQADIYIDIQYID